MSNAVSQNIAPGVVAVFVTMNRAATARVCLERLMAQSLRPERVFVVDNASSDGTPADLKEFAEQVDWMSYEILPANLGNAGGMEVAFKRVFDEGAESVWILDDDSWPEPDALRELLTAEISGECIRTCCVVDLRKNQLSWPLQIRDGEGWKLVDQRSGLPTEKSVLVRRAWLGALIPRSVYKRVGNVNGALFLRGEDEDYPRRIEAEGIDTYLMPGSLLHHPASGPLKHWHVGKYTVVVETSLEGNPLYYRLRNSWWMARRDRGILVALAMSILTGLVMLRWKPRPLSWMGVWLEALGDALMNRLGRRGSKR